MPKTKNKELMRWLGEVDKENRATYTSDGRISTGMITGSVYSWQSNAKNAGKSPRKREEDVDTAPELRNLPDDNRSRLGNEISKMNVESGHIWEAPNEYDIILP
ncbi:hypothetical protein JTB14_001603 [Gonioctena quinquepunctata]|nr:hypothetical protein JTB14_001603 [Gonioctena quinquepunctata]